jgi:hypothetical protein
MEIRTFSPDDVQGVAATTGRVIPVDQIDATFKSQYIGTHLQLQTLHSFKFVD